MKSFFVFIIYLIERFLSSFLGSGRVLYLLFFFFTFNKICMDVPLNYQISNGMCKICNLCHSVAIFFCGYAGVQKDLFLFQFMPTLSFGVTGFASIP